jgi:putative membrane protein
MSNESTQERPPDPLDTATTLSFERTYLAHERTQMAWVRTALALITFGFTVAKFFEFVQERQGERATLLHPRRVGILMITIGLTALALGSVQHALALRALRRQCPMLPRSLAGVIAGLLALLGIVELLAALIPE